MDVSGAEITTSTFTPGPPLSDFVEQFWLVEGLLDGNARELILPTGLLELIVGVSPRASTGPLLSGARSKSLVVGADSCPIGRGVEFMPGAACTPGISPREPSRNILFPLREIWGRPAVSLSERLRNAGGPELRFGILEQVLLARWHAAVFQPRRDLRGPGVSKDSGLPGRCSGPRSRAHAETIHQGLP